MDTNHYETFEKFGNIFLLHLDKDWVVGPVDPDPIVSA